MKREILEDGYYLSTYVYGDEIAYLTDATVRHDQNMSLWKKEGDNIILIHYWELERITGIKKHGKAFRSNLAIQMLIQELLEPYKIKLDDLKGIIGTPSIDTIEDYSLVNENPKLSYHSIAHLMSAVLMNTDKFYNEEIIGFGVDGGSDDVVDYDVNRKQLFAGCYVNKGKIDFFSVSSPAPLWSFARMRYGMRQGSLMALASASKSEIQFDINCNLKICNNNDIVLAYDWFEKLANKIENLRDDDKGLLFNYFDDRFSIYENKISMLMKVIQRASIEMMKMNIEFVLKKYNLNEKKVNLALSGGYTLNCITNSILMKEYNFIDFIAPPCVNDAGQSLGIALCFFYKKMIRFNFLFENAYYGNYQKDVKQIILNGEYCNYIEKVSNVTPKEIAEDLINNIIVWVNGRSEIGPRALGARSILGDPRYLAVKDRLNDVKCRQWWRPVAPIILNDYVSEWFYEGRNSKYMLLVDEVKKNKIDFVPAIAHLDTTARLQTIERDDNELLYNVITEFYELTDIPIICNTSLNDCGEPIIDNFDEAINFALRKNIEIMYIDGIRIKLKNHKLYEEKEPEKRKYNSLFEISEEEKKKELAKINPYSVPIELLAKYYRHAKIRELCVLDKKSNADKLSKLMRILERREQKIVDDCVD